MPIIKLLLIGLAEYEKSHFTDSDNEVGRPFHEINSTTDTVKQK